MENVNKGGNEADIGKIVLNSGFDKFEFRNKIVYIGAYIETSLGRFRHGKGKIIHPKPDINSIKQQESYEGDWVEDKMQGFGIYYYANGDIYEGEFYDNKHHGFGRYFFADGTKYVGEWKNHLMHGSGKYKDINGAKWKGEYRNGEYMSKEQSKLKEERRIEIKIESLIPCVKKFLLDWQSKFKQYNKKNLKDTIGLLFANESKIGAYLLGPYPEIKLKSIEDWNQIFNNCLQNYSKLKVKVAKNTFELTLIDPKKVFVNQLQEELASGQIIEIMYEIEAGLIINFAIMYSKEYESWFLVHFSEFKSDLQ